MRSKKKGFKKILAEFLCVALIACSIPGSAFAAEGENTGKGSVTSTYEANDGAAEGQKNVAGTEVKDTSDTGEQNTGEGDVKDPDGKTDTGGEVSEGEDGDPGTPGSETKESDSEETDTKEKSGDGEETGDTAQDSAEGDDGSAGESTEDSENDTEDDTNSEDDTDTDSNDEEDTEDEADIEGEDEDGSESDVTDTSKGGSASSDDEEDEEDEDDDWIDGPLDDDLMLLTASPSDAILPLDEQTDGVWQIEGEEETYLTFAEALEDAKKGDTIILLDDTEENITVTSGSEVNLDLNDQTLSAEDKDISVVTIEEGAELTLTDSGTDGCITGGEAANGGGIYNIGTLTMYGGTVSGNNSSYGGGIYNIGTLTMYGGTVNGNKSSYAGGVYNIGTFYMYDGSTISDNTALSWGGGVITGILPGEIDNGSSFTMYGGIITGNEGSGYGGGVAICSYSTFNMIDGAISNNTSNAGAGVWYYSGSFNMKGGEICENNGEGVVDYWDGFVMTGGTINKNSVGVSIPANYTIYLSGSPVIEDNTSCNVSLHSSYITLAGNFDEGASIGVTPSAVPTEDNPVQITTAEDGTEYYRASAQYFFYDGDSSYVGTPNEAGQYVELAKEHVASLTQNDTTTEYTSVQAAVTAAGSTAGTVSMLMGSTENITIASGQNITLDLAGYTLDGGQNDSVITNEGTLTLVDSSGDDSGLITGGSARYGGGVYNQGTFNMTGSTISGNSADDYGGGVYTADGTFNMTGGIIIGNTASGGGGVCLNGYTYCYITGGKLCNNNASYSGADFGTEIAGGCFATILKASDMMGNSDSDHCYNWYLDSSLFSGRYSYPDNVTDKYTNSSVIGSSSPGHLTSTTELILAGDEGHLYNEEDVTFNWDGTESCTATFICSDCEHEESVKCDVTSVIVTEPDCTDAGYGIYTATATITNRNGTALLKTDSKEETIPALGHEWDKGVVTKEATCTDDGIITYTCTRCGATKTEEIKALGHEWVVDRTIIENSEDRYEERVGMKCARCGLEYEEEIVVSTESTGVTAHSSLSWSDLISEDELADLFEANAELDFKLSAEALAENDVPSADRTLAEDLIVAQWPDADYTASWLDISVLLDIIHSTGEEETREYNSTLNPVTITVAIPDELLNADGDTYAVIRIHEGEAAVLNTTDNGDGTLTFESDLFSTYVIVKTVESDSGDGGSGSGGSGSRRSNSSNGRSSGSSGSGVSGAGASLAYSTGTWTIDELGHWRYTDSNGRRYENEWGYIYNPYADTSAGQPSASWFHFGYDGIMDTGWYIDSDGKIYYLNPSLDNTQGAMLTGWAFIDGKWYYFDASGALLRSTQTPDGYTVDETGARVEE